MTPEQAKQLAATTARVNALIDGADTIATDWSTTNPRGSQPVWTVRQIKDLAERVAHLETGPALTDTQLETLADQVVARLHELTFRAAG